MNPQNSAVDSGVDTLLLKIVSLAVKSRLTDTEVGGHGLDGFYRASRLSSQFGRVTGPLALQKRCWRPRQGDRGEMV